MNINEARSGRTYLEPKRVGPRFDPLRLSFLLKKKKKKSGLWTLSCDFAHTVNETIKWLTQLPTSMQNQPGGDSVASRCLI